MVASKMTLNPVHLGLGATTEVQSDFTGAMDCAARSACDGVEGRLVSMHEFSESWGMWEKQASGIPPMCLMRPVWCLLPPEWAHSIGHAR